MESNKVEIVTSKGVKLITPVIAQAKNQNLKLPVNNYNLIVQQKPHNNTNAAGSDCTTQAKTSKLESTHDSSPHKQKRHSNVVQPDTPTIKSPIIKSSAHPRAPSNFDVPPSQQTEYGMHGFVTKKQNPIHRPAMIHNQDVVQVSMLFNSKQEQVAQVNQSLTKKAILPNLNARHRDMASSTNIGTAYKNDLGVHQEKKYSATTQKQSEFQPPLVRGLQEQFQEEEDVLQSPTCGSKSRLNSVRKASQPQPLRDSQNTLVQAVSSGNKKGSGIQSKVKSIGHFPKIGTGSIQQADCTSGKDLQSSSSQIILTNDRMGDPTQNKQFQKQIQGDYKSSDFQKWFKTPNFQMQGKALIDQQQLKQGSLESLQKIRGNAVNAPSRTKESITCQPLKNNQFQNMSHQSSSTRNTGLQTGLAMNKTEAHTVQPINLRARGLGVFSPSIHSPDTQPKMDSSLIVTSVFKPSTEKPPVVPSNNQSYTTPGNSRQGNQNLNSTQQSQNVVNSRLDQRKKTGSMQILLESGGTSESKCSAHPTKQEDQIKKIIQEDITVVMDQDKSAQTMQYVSKITLSQPVKQRDVQNEVIDQTKDTNDLSQMSKSKEQKTGSNKSEHKVKKKNIEKHNRNFSQGQKQARNSLTSKPRQNNTGKEGNCLNQINSPIMQPPPQILQSKIIINLLRTEYPLIEEVAKQVMGWRVSKSENPNTEFDIYWHDIGIDSEKLASLKPYQKTNHFPLMFQITRKGFLAKNLKRLQKLYPLEFDFFPKTWILPNELNELRTYSSQKRPKKSASVSKRGADSKPETATKNEDQAIVATPIQNKEKQKESHPTPSIHAKLGHDDLTKNGYTPIAASKTTAKLAKEGQSDSSHDGEDDDDKSDSDEDGESSGEAPLIKDSINPYPHIKMEKTDITASPSKKKAPKDQRKANVNFKAMNNKSRFPMIVKPDCSSQGKGIFITHDIDSIPKDEVLVVQQYMQHPHLIEGLKYDMRLYVLVLSCEPLKIFLYNDGLVRFCTQKYKPIDPNADKSQLNNMFMHLTNYAINKESESFTAPKNTQDDKGHKRTLKKVMERLKEMGLDTDRIMGEIKDVIIKTMISIQHDLAHNYRTCQPADLENLMCFEILGFDVILNEKGKAILLEVNQAPSFATDSPLDYEIKKGLFIDMFRLLNLSVDKKKAKIKRIFEEKKERMLTKLTLKQKNAQRRDIMKELRKEQDAYEALNHGNFEKIYPLPIKEAAESNAAAQDNVELTVQQKQLAQSQYQALLRQQERYNQLLMTVGNIDIEKAIRAKKRLDENNIKDEKTKETKTKIKNKEKKRLEEQVKNARLSSLQKIKHGYDSIAQTEESIDQAMRSTILKPQGNLDVQKIEQGLRQSIGDRLTDSKSHDLENLKTNDAQSLQQSKTGFQMSQSTNQTLSHNFTMKSPSGSAHQQMQSSFLEILNQNDIQENNYHKKQLYEIQQKMMLAGAMNGPKTQTFNLVNLMMPQNQASLTGRTGSNKKQMLVSDYVSGIDGLMPNVTSLTNHNQISQSQNPINPAKLKSSEYDMKMNWTGQNINKNNFRPGNLLPNIAKNLMPPDASSFGVQTNNVSSVVHSQQSQDFNSRSSSNNQQSRFRGPVGPQAVAAAAAQMQMQYVTAQQAAVDLKNQNQMILSPTAKSSSKTTAIDFSRKSTQAPKAAMQMKIQQMNLSAMNIQPVIIDSNHFNTEEYLNKNQSPTKKIPLNAIYTTQKFSKIQLQAIIDNLYQYEGKAVKKGSNVPGSKDLAKTTTIQMITQKTFEIQH